MKATVGVTRAFCSVVAIFLCLGLSGCERSGEALTTGEHEFFRTNLINRHLRPRLHRTMASSGFVYPHMSRDWSQPDGSFTSPTQQARAIYSFAIGFELTADSSYRREMEKALKFLLENQWDAKFGGFFNRVDANGKVIHARKRGFAQVTAMFALAHAFRVTRNLRYKEAAYATWAMIRSHLTDRQGGLYTQVERDFRYVRDHRAINPVMHYLEAQLAFYEVFDDSTALAGAEQTANFIVTQLLVPGGYFIPDYYREDWTPYPDDEDGYVNLGHNAELAFLLSRGVELGLPTHYLKTGERLLQRTLDTGYDEQSGGLFSRADYAGNNDGHKSWWQQAELLRTLMHYAAHTGRGDLWARYRKTRSFVQNEFLDPINGGWYPLPYSQCENAKCSRQPGQAYHISAMHEEAMRLTRPE